MRKIILFLIFSLWSLNCFSQSNLDTVYVRLEKGNKLLKYNVSKDSATSSFSILMDKYKTKEQREEYAKQFPPGQTLSFRLNFISIKHPIIKDLSDTHLYSVEDLSKLKVKLGHSVLVGFVEEQFRDEQYIVYITKLVFQE